MKELMVIELYKVSEHDIYEIKSTLKNENHLMSPTIGLPEYCFNENNKNIDFAEYYFQWIGLSENDSSKNKYFYLFDIVFTTNLLQEEISMIGISEDCFNFYELLKNIEITTDKSIDVNENKLLVNKINQRIIPIQLILTYDLNYWGHGEDFESEVIFTGYLDGNLKEVKTWELLPF